MVVDEYDVLSIFRFLNIVICCCCLNHEPILVGFDVLKRF